VKPTLDGRASLRKAIAEAGQLSSRPERSSTPLTILDELGKVQQGLDGRRHDEQSNHKAVDVPLGVREQSPHVMEEQAARGGGDEGGSERDEFDATQDGGRVLTLCCEGRVVEGVARLRLGGVQDETAVGGVVDVPGDC
jgi:hypothetical protein